MTPVRYLLRLPGFLLSLVLVILCFAAAGLIAVCRQWLGPVYLAAITIFLAAVGVVLLAASSSWRDLLLLARILLNLRRSLPNTEARPTGRLLESPVTLTYDHFGIPTITARSRLDAVRSLGFVTARDRLFQMDLIRRGVAGKMSEVFGPATLDMDVAKRKMGFGRAAAGIRSALPEEQQQLLRAYADGVNAFMDQTKVWPFEFLVFGYKPDPWEMEDSILVMLHMFDVLSVGDRSVRMLRIMGETLPPEVVAFLTPDTDCYGEVLMGGADSHRPATAPPVDAMASLLAARKNRTGTLPGLVNPECHVPGSNCWAVGKAKTSDGRAIVANDLHLGLSVPNVWYRTKLCYENRELCGAVLPGIPLVVVGANKHVAWGMTNLRGDCRDVVPLRINPDNNGEYLTAGGWQPFESMRETIRVRGHEPVVADFRHTIWGPVSENPLMGEQVATQWTALEPGAVDFGLIKIDAAENVEQAVQVLTHFAGPPMNAVIADDGGRIAYTVCGRLPLREESDVFSPSRGGGRAAWERYIPAAELPRLFDPPSGYLVTANNRALGKEFPHVLGHDFCNGYRARRISDLLRDVKDADERRMFELQSDAACQFYEFYRNLALEVLPPEAVSVTEDLEAIRSAMRSWDGKAEPTSNGLAVLIAFREMLTNAVFAPFLERCVEADESFVYCWQNLETPLRILLTEQEAALLPDEHYSDWHAFIRGKLEATADSIRKRYELASLDDLRWRRFNKAFIVHPLSAVLPILRKLLNMPHDPLRGCLECVCVASPTFGSSLRIVVSPGRAGDGLCQSPCGQAGHPLSPHYDDQHGSWVKQEALPFLPGAPASTLVINPHS